MSYENRSIILEAVPNQARANELIGKLFEVTRPNAVFSDPVVQGDFTVITASEVTIAMGTGYGGGGGSQPVESEAGSDSDRVDVGNLGYGGGGGGGGTATGRPVAAIIVGPTGVDVETIVDPTKIAMAFLTTIGAIFMAAARIRRLAKRQG